MKNTNFKLNLYNDHIAICFNRNTISFKDLDNLSNQYAHYFSSNGITSGTIVGICLERHIDMICVIIGIFKCGACYIPLDPAFPTSRKTYMIDDSGLEFIITEKDLTRDLSVSPNIKLLRIDHDKKNIDTKDQNDLNIELTPDMLAYIIYTSGSRGNPKGVQIQHKALLNFLLSMKKKPGIDSSDRILAITTLSFDISGLEILLPLISIATVVLAPQEVAKDGNALIPYIEENNVTVMQATPATYQMLFELGWKNRTVKKILCGGEAMSQDLANKLLSTGAEVWNMYGPTETTIWSSIYQITEENSKPLIAKAIDNTELIIVDDNMNPVSGNQEGEQKHKDTSETDINTAVFVLNLDKICSEEIDVNNMKYQVKMKRAS